MCSQVLLQMFINLPVTDCERLHYNSNQRIFLCLYLEWFLPVSIMFLLNPIECEIITGYCLIEYVTMTGGTMLHLKHCGACRLCFPLPGAPSPLPRLHWAGEILYCKLAVNLSFLQPFCTQTVGTISNAKQLDRILKTYIESYFLNNLA